MRCTTLGPEELGRVEGHSERGRLSPGSGTGLKALFWEVEGDVGDSWWFRVFLRFRALG